MLNIEKRINEIDENKPSLDDLKYVSIATHYMGLRKERDFRTMRRLNKLIYYFPSLIEKNDFKSIIGLLENPESLVRVSSRQYGELENYEKYAVNKTAEELGRDISTVTWSIVFKIKYFFEYFKL